MMNTREPQFRVGVTRDFLNSDGELVFGDIGLGLLHDRPDISVEFMPNYGDVLPSSVGGDYDAMLVLAPRVTADTVAGATRLSIVARFGVGYDNVDVAACTANAVLLTITPDGVRRPVAVSALAFLLALTHKLIDKDRITREGRWSEKLDYMGIGLTGRTLGLIGLGNIGREISSIAAPLDMRHVACDPFANAQSASEIGVELLSLEELLKQSDFVCICCALTSETHHLLDAERLGMMKSSAYLINVARGPVVDQAALTALLQKRSIAGAALDVFENEPIDTNDPLLTLDNVILSPHAICWTDELFAGNGRAACQSILDVAAGNTPKTIGNREVLDQPGLRQKLARS